MGTRLCLRPVLRSHPNPSLAFAPQTKIIREVRKGTWLCGLVVSVLHEGSINLQILTWVRASDALSVFARAASPH